MCIQQITSTIPNKIDWNFYNSSTILMVRWITPDLTLNLEEDNNTTTCWLYDGQNDSPSQ